MGLSFRHWWAGICQIGSGIWVIGSIGCVRYLAASLCPFLIPRVLGAVEECAADKMRPRSSLRYLTIRGANVPKKRQLKGGFYQYRKENKRISEVVGDPGINDRLRSLGNNIYEIQLVKLVVSSGNSNIVSRIVRFVSNYNSKTLVKSVYKTFQNLSSSPWHFRSWFYFLTSHRSMHPTVACSMPPRHMVINEAPVGRNLMVAL